MTDAPKLEGLNVGEMLVEMGDDIESHAADAGGREIRFDLPWNEDNPFLVVGEGEMIRRALWAVVSNAIDHTGAGDRVVVKMRRVEDNVTVTVSDNGPGVPDDVLESLFVPYHPAFPR